jgi:hypothetical protein
MPLSRSMPASRSAGTRGPSAGQPEADRHVNRYVGQTARLGQGQRAIPGVGGPGRVKRGGLHSRQRGIGPGELGGIAVRIVTAR